MRIALAQLRVDRDPIKARSLLTQSVGAAGEAGARMIVLPEYASGFDPRGVSQELAEHTDEYIATMQSLSAAWGICIVAGVVRTSGLKVLNTLVVVDGGEVVLTYDKVHLYDAFGYRESDTFLSGDVNQPGVFICDDVTFGVQTCYDLRFPEITRLRAEAGAHVIINPAAWVAGPGKLLHWRTLLQARAIENTAVVLGVAMAGEGVCGHSMVVRADGVVAHELEQSPGLLVTDVSAADIYETRERNPSLRNRRI
ncbi:carbon-nitrogen hydrolase family protein [Timonella sp. A28]|uniref:carbon-nitrogen hydrolase family protein n=1 Tax=Timonella sp. A28 TaxID=3442640 RepID=UPI003EC0C791